MIKVRPAGERGIVDHGWLLARHSFSFASYYDPEHTGFRALLVINEDTVQPGRGFGTHGHQDMEIVTYVLGGTLEHEDNMGTRGILRPGDVQVMSAGTGVTHSEVNHSPDAELHLLQIWIVPDRNGHEPRYDERHYPAEARRNRLCLVASGDRSRDTLWIHQDAHVHASLLDAGSEVTHELAPGRGAWLQVARGALDVDGTALATGDGAAIEDETTLRIRATGPAEVAEFLLFDMS